MRIFIVVSIVVTMGGAFVPTSAFADKDSAGSRVYEMRALNGSREYGTVALKPRGTSTNVEIHLLHAPRGVMQPAHIHMGTCAHLNPAPKYALSNVLDGTSDGTIPVSVSTLLASPMAVNVHKSGTDLKDYVACADLQRGA